MGLRSSADSGPPAAEVRSRIPDRYREKTVREGLVTFLVPTLGWLACTAGIVFAPWWGKVLLAFPAGILVGMMFVVGHDAGHGSLFPRRWMNRISGRVCLLPSLHPFTAWTHNHNGLHHGFTNIKERDPGFPPLSPAEYRARSWAGRMHYRLCRTWYGLGYLYLTEMWLKWELFPSADRAPRNPKAFRFDRLLVVAFAAVWVGGLVAAGLLLEESAWAAAGLVVLGFAVPYAVWNWFISFLIFQQHTHPRIPWFSERDLPMPSYYQAQVRATPHVIFGAPFRWLMRHVMEHTAHHADPTIPLYHLTDAQKTMDREFRRDLIRLVWSPKMFLETMRVCKLYDFDAHRWVGYDGTPLTPVLLAPEPAETAPTEPPAGEPLSASPAAPAV